MPFPDHFTWGAATSAFQIEGATRADGRGESIWDRFAAQPGAIEDGTDGVTTCDHYHRWREDLDLMARLELGAYRFSVAWPRVLPEGHGRVNDAGLDFYDRLVDGLLDRGITPWVTLYHWDLPQPLEDAGGWPARATVDAFVAYTDVVTRRLGDRVKHWVTQNEPWIVANLGYRSGEHAPGRSDPAASLAAAHHLLLAHGRAVPVIRQHVRGVQVGIVLNLVPGHAASERDEDVAAARTFDGFFNRWYLEPLYRGRYPDDVVAHHRRELDGADPLAAVRPGDLGEIRAATDFLGLNYYSRARLRAGTGDEPAVMPAPPPPRPDQTDMGWEVYPDGLREMLVRLHRDYAPRRLVVTENGAAYSVGPGPGGEVEDRIRVDYLRVHLAACEAAIAEGAPLAGYFVWSLMDNFEWAFGHSKRFGITWVDYASQARTPKRSAYWYREVVRRNGLEWEGAA